MSSFSFKYSNRPHVNSTTVNETPKIILMNDLLKKRLAAKPETTMKEATKKNSVPGL